MRVVAVDLLVPHRLHRWVLPLGLLGLIALVGLTWALPKDVAGPVFVIARIVFVAAYLALVAVGLTPKRRPARVHVDAAGLHDETAVLVARHAIARVIASRASGRTTIQIRGATPLGIEVIDEEDARALLAGLDPGHDAATLAFLASTTPVAYAIVTWMGVPAVIAPLAMQLIMTRHVPATAMMVGAIPLGIAWLGGVWWFSRRRTITLSTTEIGMPRVFRIEPEPISLGEITNVVERDAFTLELQFAGRRRSRSFKIYDPALLAELVEQLRVRRRVS